MLDEVVLELNEPPGTTAGPRPVQRGELADEFPGVDKVAAIGPVESGAMLLLEVESAAELESPLLLFPAGMGKLPSGEAAEAPGAPEPNVGGGGGPMVVKFAQAIFVRLA